MAIKKIDDHHVDLPDAHGDHEKRTNSRHEQSGAQQFRLENFIVPCAHSLRQQEAHGHVQGKGQQRLLEQNITRQVLIFGPYNML
jgi:hypothetical protein